jgi:hypothetical protein
MWQFQANITMKIISMICKMQKPIVMQNDTKSYTHLVFEWVLKMISLVVYYKLTNIFWFSSVKLALKTRLVSGGILLIIYLPLKNLLISYYIKLNKLLA